MSDLVEGEFAKVFGVGKDQVCVLIQSGDKGPEVQFYFKPDGLGVCMQAIGFDDNDAGWDKAEAFFLSVDETKATLFVNATKASIAEQMK